MARWRWLIVLVVLVGWLGAAWSAWAQTVPARYFPETGHTLSGDFMRFFDEHGGLEIFGYPISVEFDENGRRMQCFQHMRLDLYPENQPPTRVQPGPLGELLGRREPPIPASDIPLPGDPDHRYFSETGHRVSYAFLNYFNQHGGLDTFGYPITEFKFENGRIVQYFQNARFEWYPDLPPDQRVRLGNLGEAYAALALDPGVLRPPPGRPAPQQVLALRPIASLQSAVTARSGTQKLHVYVVDQQGRPVPSANVKATVHFPTGDVELTLPPTDQRGYTLGTFNLGQQQPGRRIVLDVRVGYEALAAYTRTSFLVWW